MPLEKVAIAVKMKKEDFLGILKNKVLVLDGAMGTSLQKLGFEKCCPEELNLTNPKIIEKIHKSYVDAGSDIIITNTFGANRSKLKQYKLDNKIREINEAAVDIAKKAAGKKALVAGDIGPLDKYIEPLDELSFDEAHEIFAEQVKALNKADLLIIETVSDVKILKAAIIAAKENSDLPIIANMTFEKGRTVTGTDVETFAAIAESLGADVIGANCSESVEGHYDIAKKLAKNTNLPIAIQPNAGLPEIINGKAVFSETPEKFKEYSEKFYEAGVNIIGGCCGTTPEHIKAISFAVKNKSAVKRKTEEKTKLCSRIKTVTIGDGTKIVGERINPTNKKNLIEEIKQGKTNLIRKQALLQLKEGAAFLDINVGVPGIDEPGFIKKAISAVQNVVNAPLVIDTSNPKALEEALKQSDGKPLINSVNARKESLETALPLAKKYGAAIIALTLEKGIPKTVEERIEIAEKIIKEAKKYGIKEKDIIIDCVTLTIATNPENENILLKSLKEIKNKGYKTILGISNISHGLPNRSEINSKFLTKASKAGLDLAIINPLDNIMQADTKIKYLEEEVKIKKEDYSKLSTEKQLHNAVLYGDSENIIEIIENALKKHKALEINDILIKALEEVGDKFNKKIYFLPQVLLSAATMKKAFERLKNELSKEGGKVKGKVLLATVENDIHDIGKNILKALLESHNFEVIDLGKDVSAKKIISEAKKQKPDIIALSALMTTTAIEMENVIKELRKNNIELPVIIGGAVITADYAKQIKANYGKDALTGVKKVGELIG